MLATTSVSSLVILNHMLPKLPNHRKAKWLAKMSFMEKKLPLVKVLCSFVFLLDMGTQRFEILHLIYARVFRVLWSCFFFFGVERYFTDNSVL